MKNLTEKKLLSIAALVTCLFALGWATSHAIKTRMTDRQDRNLARDGDFDGAMAQARELMAALQQNNWKHGEGFLHLLTLPEQIYDEVKVNRSNPSFCLPTRHPGYEEIAFFTDLYVSLNLEVVPGIEGRLHPEGWYLVGYKTGEIKWIPLNDCRMYDMPDAPEPTQLIVFPGMRLYNPSLPKPFGL